MIDEQQIRALVEARQNDPCRDIFNDVLMGIFIVFVLLRVCLYVYTCIDIICQVRDRNRMHLWWLLWITMLPWIAPVVYWILKLSFKLHKETFSTNTIF